MFTDLSGFSKNAERFGIIHFLQTIKEAEKIYIEGFLGEFVDKISNEEMQKKAFNYITSIS